MNADVLSLHQLVKRYGGLVATDHLDLNIRHGEIHAIIGPNGAGKTTLIQQISGAIAPDRGRICFHGQDITRTTMHQRVRLGLARSYQITSVFPACSVLDNIALAVQARRGSSMRFWKPALADGALFEEARAIGCRIGLAARIHMRAGNLAHGEQRQLEVGLALATSPALLLLDEPMAGMGDSTGMIALLDSLRNQLGIVLIEHDMHAVFQLADRISVLVSGRIIATGTAEQIRNDAQVRKAYLGDEAMA
ncbi:ABC transporter ATP-binding protein [Verminephrobacter eiseniae]|uniref:ABC transporter ATP-binding protein n=1 Tax=Verminephrobacter eiseniae TaxID=364317 RepID=UPI0022370F5B|nr:ABC transporter ATP-binding protein [Verminephrobacter eiseniae]MCW5236673.1 ABC transporter ATP-binding protein [Verminephrobacter eiseniae]